MGGAYHPWGTGKGQGSTISLDLVDISGLPNKTKKTKKTHSSEDRGPNSPLP